MRSFFTFVFRNKFYYLIEVIGLSLSLAFILPLLSFSGVRWSIDHSHPNWRQVYEVCPISESQETTWGLTEQIRNSEPDIMAVTHFRAYNFGYETPVYYKQESFSIQKMVVGRDFFSFFPASVITGDLKGLEDRYQLAVSESFAARSGINCGDVLIHEDQTYSVCAIFGNYRESLIPDVDIIFGENSPLLDNERTNPDSWWNEIPVFIRVKEGTDIQVLTEKLSRLCNEYYADYYRVHEQHKNALRLRRYDKVSSWLWNTALTSTGGLGFYFMSVLAVVLIVFSLLNCTLLNTALTTLRAKEMATRRLLGSSKKEIIVRVLSESLIITAICFVLGWLLSSMVFGRINELMTGFGAPLNLSNNLSLPAVVFYVIALLVVSFLSGIIPARVLAQYSPLDVVRGEFKYQIKSILGKVFIGLQCVFSVAMVAILLLNLFQFDNAKSRPLGCDVNDTFMITGSLPEPVMNSTVTALRELPCVEYAGLANDSPGDGLWGLRYFEDETIGKHQINVISCTEDAFRAFGIEMMSGQQGGFGGYLTESAYNWFESSNAPEELMRQIGIPQLNGVVKDFVGRIQGDGIRAIEITETGPFDRIIVKTIGDHSECRANIMDIYKKMTVQMLGYCPEPRESGYIPDAVQKKINESIEGSLLRLLFFFSVLPLILALSGIMAMSTFYVTSHRRDISIRKIFGGSIGQETRTYLWRFLRIMFIGNLVGIPLAFWVNSSIYLGIPMSAGGSIWIYLLTFAITMLMAFMCVFPQVFQAARTNPALELKKE